MNFGEVLEGLKKIPEKRYARDGWNGKRMWISLQPGVEAADGTPFLPFIYMRTVRGEMVPWLASQTDMLMDDWTEVVE